MKRSFDLAVKTLALIPAFWICLGLSIKGAFFLSTGRWPESATFNNPVVFPTYLTPAFDLFLVMVVYSFIYLPAILGLMTVNFLMLTKERRQFFVIWLPFYSTSVIAAFVLLRYLGKSFEYYT